MSNVKISVVIPTLQKDKKLLENLITVLNKDDSVLEIIIIDNSGNGFQADSTSKIKVIVLPENIYVNPSWNLGLKNIKSEYFAIFNDDLVVPENFCSDILKHLNEDMGLVGVDIQSIETIQSNYKEDDLIMRSKLKPILLRCNERNLHWGTIILGHRNSYHFIPSNMLIWCGDDYLFHKNLSCGKQNYVVSNCKIKHIHGFSSGEDRFLLKKYSDCKIMKKYFPNFVIPKQFSGLNGLKLKIKAIWG